jgi:hypothetical protein
MQNGRLVAESVKYYSTGDEQAFFAWLNAIPCVVSADGKGTALTISLSRPPIDEELREFIALFHRYRVDMRQLAGFLTDANQHWFRDKDAYWFRGVFG